MNTESPSHSSSFWYGKRVLITGHTGFKGGWLSLWLQQLGAEVVGLSLSPPTTPSLFQEARVAEGMTSLHEDIRDLEAVRTVFAEWRPEIVFHLAAQSLVPHSYQKPVDTYTTNVMGTIHVLEAIRHTDSVRVGVFVTSDKCYENQESALWGFRETDRMGGKDPYSNSKGCAELVVASYRDSFFSDRHERAESALGSVRAGNVVGGGDWAEDRLLPDILRAFSEGRPVYVRSPEAVRPWQHVLDPLAGYMELARHLWRAKEAYVGGWNFGPSDRDVRPVQYVVDKMIEKWGPDATAVIDDGPHPPEATYLRLDCSKARTLLGWQPVLGLDDALTWTVEWHRAVHDGADMRKISLAQIRRYRDRVEADGSRERSRSRSRSAVL
jgi:CDP-glucose 4,6-dehydratase